MPSPNSTRSKWSCRNRLNREVHTSWGQFWPRSCQILRSSRSERWNQLLWTRYVAVFSTCNALVTRTSFAMVMLAINSISYWRAQSPCGSLWLLLICEDPSKASVIKCARIPRITVLSSCSSSHYICGNTGSKKWRKVRKPKTIKSKIRVGKKAIMMWSHQNKKLRKVQQVLRLSMMILNETARQI